MSDILQPDKTTKRIGWLIIATTAMFVMITSCRMNAQVTFTHEELIQLADQNLERLQCLKLSRLSQRENDSLYAIIDKQSMSISYRDSIINNFMQIHDDEKLIRYTLVETNKQINDQVKTLNDKVKTRDRKLNFWRIFTPISITSVVIMGLISN